MRGGLSPGVSYLQQRGLGMVCGGRRRRRLFFSKKRWTNYLRNTQFLVHLKNRCTKNQLLNLSYNWTWKFTLIACFFSILYKYFSPPFLVHLFSSTFFRPPILVHLFSLPILVHPFYPDALYKKVPKKLIFHFSVSHFIPLLHPNLCMKDLIFVFSLTFAVHLLFYTYSI